MAEDKKETLDDLLSEVDDIIEKELEEVNNLTGSDTKKDSSKEDAKENEESPDTTNNNDDKTNEATGDTREPDAPSTPSAPSTTSQGMSQAYAEVPECDIYGNPISKPEESVEKNYPKPPKRGDKPKKDDKESSIMDLFWKDFILASYDWVIDTTVDTTLDFIDYVLYHRNEEKKEDKKEKIDIYSIGRTMRESTKEKMLKKKEVSLRGYEEIVNNLERDKKGQQPEWKLLKKEPSFFKKLSEINKKDPLDRSEGEKELMAEFKEVPNVMNRMLNEGIRLKEIAIASATCECVANYKDEYPVSYKFSEALETLEKGIKNNNTPEINNSMKELNQEVALDVPLYNDIKSTLVAISYDLENNKTQDAVEKIKAIKEKSAKEVDSPDHWKAVIIAKQHSYFQEIEKEKEAINNQDEHSVSLEFSSYLKLLKQNVEDTPLREQRDKKTLMASFENMTKRLNPEVEKEAKMQEYLQRFLEAQKDTPPQDIASALKKGIEGFKTKYPNFDKDTSLSKDFVNSFNAVSTSIDTTARNKENNKALVTAYLKNMSKACEDKGGEALELKAILDKSQKAVEKLNEKEVASYLSQEIETIETKHREMNPIRKEKQEYYGSLVTGLKSLKLTIDDYSKSTLNRSSKKKKMHDSLNSMKNIITSHPERKGSTSNKVEYDSHTIGLEILKQSTASR